MSMAEEQIGELLVAAVQEAIAEHGRYRPFSHSRIVVTVSLAEARPLPTMLFGMPLEIEVAE